MSDFSKTFFWKKGQKNILDFWVILTLREEIWPLRNRIEGYKKMALPLLFAFKPDFVVVESFKSIYIG